MTERQIIQGCKGNESRAQRCFVDNYSAYIYSICYRYLADATKAQDALQETLIQILTNLDKYQDRGKFKSWISSVTVRKCLDLMRKENRHKHSYIDEVAEPISQNTTFKKLELQEVLKFIETIPDRYRIAINMFLIEGYTHQEIAKELGVTEGSSRSLVSRGRKMIQEAFALKDENNIETKVSGFNANKGRLKII